VAKKHKSLSIGGLVAIVETNPIGFGIIDEDGGGPGLRLRKRPRAKPR
jgi:hypothetical protein